MITWADPEGDRENDLAQVRNFNVICSPPPLFFYLPSEHPNKSAKDSVPYPDSEFAPAVHNNRRNVSSLRITGSAQLAAMWRMACISSKRAMLTETRNCV